MDGYKILDHTADIGIEVRGRTLNKIFVESVNGLYFILLGELPQTSGRKIFQRISLDAYDLETLLVRWLNEILFYATVHRRYFDKIDVRIERNLQKNKLTARLSGYNLNCCFQHEVKSATYHGLKIQKTVSGYKTKIIFDI